MCVCVWLAHTRVQAGVSGIGKGGGKEGVRAGRERQRQQGGGRACSERGAGRSLGGGWEAAEAGGR